MGSGKKWGQRWLLLEDISNARIKRDRNWIEAKLSKMGIDFEANDNDVENWEEIVHKEAEAGCRNFIIASDIHGFAKAVSGFLSVKNIWKFYQKFALLPPLPDNEIGKEIGIRSISAGLAAIYKGKTRKITCGVVRWRQFPVEYIINPLTEVDSGWKEQLFVSGVAVPAYPEEDLFKKSGKKDDKSDEKKEDKFAIVLKKRFLARFPLYYVEAGRMKKHLSAELIYTALTKTGRDKLLCPSADLFSGKITTVMIDAPPGHGFPASFFSEPSAVSVSGRSVYIRCTVPTTLYIDGKLSERYAYEIYIQALPNAVNLIVGH
ncbi:MAG: hypothetical protein QW728_04210 [Thermoplasmata archaeon]